jgi:hypothetical protein
MVREEKIEEYILTNQLGHFLGGNSISYDNESEKYIYAYSEYLTNGFYTYPTEVAAQKDLYKLQELANKLNFKIEFFIKKINAMEIIVSESKLEKKHIKYKYINKNLAIA